MGRESSIEGLLASACPSIQYRLRREILAEAIPPDERQVLQERILRDEVVREIIASQSPDGWLGNRFHGYDSLEAGIRVLCEKGVDPRQPALGRALQALEANTDRVAREMGNVGKVLDEGGFGGTAMMRATVFAYAGLENKSLVQEQIKKALEGFQGLLSIHSLDEIAETYKGKLVFRQSLRWPGLYHLRLLAFTSSWRRPSARKMVAEAIKRLVMLSPLPYINIRFKSQLIAPAAFAMQDFNPVMASMTAPQWMLWFHRMELLARLGVIRMIPELQNQLENLSAMLDNGEGWFTKTINHPYFKRWGAYTGLMLERDWKIEQRRIFDLTFRSLLIQAYSKENA